MKLRWLSCWLSSWLVLLVVLSWGGLGCGKYGPPVRVYEREDPAQPSDPDSYPDKADDESEPRSDQP